MDILTVAVSLIDLVVKLLGPEDAKRLLTAKAVSLANDAADIVERERWPDVA